VKNHYSVKQTIVIRTDLQMTAGKMCAQAAHASMAVLLNASQRETLNGTLVTVIRHWMDLTAWLDHSFAKIGLRAESEEELRDIIQKAKDAGLPVAEITDNGFTHFKGVPTLTCCAIGPAKLEEIDKITGHLKLL